MAERIQLELVTPIGVVAHVEALELAAPGANGEFGVLPGHTVYLSQLSPGEVRFRDGEKSRFFSVGRGFAEIGPTRAVILVESAEEAWKLQPGEIREAIAQDEARLKTLSTNDGEYEMLSDRLELNRARLKVSVRR